MGKMKYTGMVQDASGDYDSYRDEKKKERLIANATGKEKGAAGAGRGFVNPEPAKKYAKGGAVRGCGIARKGFGKGTMR